MIQKRLNELRKKMVKDKLDAVIISQPQNIRYLSNFAGGEGYLFITAEKQIAVNNFIYIEQIRAEAPDFAIHQVKTHGDNWLKEVTLRLKLGSIGFEAEHLSFTTAKTIIGFLDGSGVNFVPISNFVEEIRMAKNKEEIENITKAAEIGDNALNHVSANLKEGMTEKEVAWQLEMHMRSNGSEVLPFDIIVASGPNGALPHAIPTDRKIKAGEPIVIDMGARYNGYASDITRTLYLGEPDEMFIKIYNIVLEAQSAAMSGIKPNMKAADADGIAREVINSAGYKDNYGHGLGHGVGLNVHEMPFIGPESKNIIPDDTVFTIEPGIYIPGWGGVRIEDTCHMEYGKIKALTKAKKNIY